MQAFTRRYLRNKEVRTQSGAQPSKMGDKLTRGEDPFPKRLLPASPMLLHSICHVLYTLSPRLCCHSLCWQLPSGVPNGTAWATWAAQGTCVPWGRGSVSLIFKDSLIGKANAVQKTKRKVELIHCFSLAGRCPDLLWEAGFLHASQLHGKSTALQGREHPLSQLWSTVSPSNLLCSPACLIWGEEKRKKALSNAVGVLFSSSQNTSVLSVRC